MSQSAHAEIAAIYETITFVTTDFAVVFSPNKAQKKMPMLATLETRNKVAKTATAALSSAMDAHHQVFYNSVTGVLKLVKLVKTQLSRTPGTDSAAYQQIVALDFRRY